MVLSGKVRKAERNLTSDMFFTKTEAADQVLFIFKTSPVCRVVIIIRSAIYLISQSSISKKPSRISRKIKRRQELANRLSRRPASTPCMHFSTQSGISRVNIPELSKHNHPPKKYFRKPTYPPSKTKATPRKPN